MLIEDITYVTDGRCSARHRSSEGIFAKDHVVIITSDKHIQNLTPFSSQALFEKAKKVPSNYKAIPLGSPAPVLVSLADRLFATSDTAIRLGLRQQMEKRKFVYVTKTGQFYDDALHIAVINNDPELVEFLIHYGNGIDPDKTFAFPGLYSVVKDGVYHCQFTTLTGTPLKAAANSYVQVQHEYPLRAEYRERAKPWQKMMNVLIDHGATWSAFADEQPLLGDISHMKADGQSMLERAMDYNDAWTFKNIIKAAATGIFTINWLPCSHFFNFDRCAGFNILEVTRLKQPEVRWVIRVLHDEEKTIGQEDDLCDSVPELLWRKLPQMDITKPLMAALLRQVLSLIPVDPPPNGWTVAKNLEHLLQCKNPKPNMKEWAEVNNYTSILHYIAEKDRTDVMRILLENGHYHFIYKENDDGQTPLDIANEHNNTELRDLLLEYDAGEGHSLQGTGTPDLKQKGKRSSRQATSSPASEPPPWSPYEVERGRASPIVIPQRSSQDLSGLRRSPADLQSSLMKRMIGIFKSPDTMEDSSQGSLVVSGFGHYEDKGELLEEQHFVLDDVELSQKSSDMTGKKIFGKKVVPGAEILRPSSPNSTQDLTKTHTTKALPPSPPISATENSDASSNTVTQIMSPGRNYEQGVSSFPQISEPAVWNVSQPSQKLPSKPSYAAVIASPSLPLDQPGSYNSSQPRNQAPIERVNSIGLSQGPGGVGIERASSPNWQRNSQQRPQPRSSIVKDNYRATAHSPGSSSNLSTGSRSNEQKLQYTQQQQQQPRNPMIWWQRGNQGSSFPQNSGN